MRIFITSPLGYEPADPAHQEADELSGDDTHGAEKKSRRGRIGGRYIRRAQEDADTAEKRSDHCGLEQRGEKGDGGEEAEQTSEDPREFLCGADVFVLAAPGEQRKHDEPDAGD